MSKTDAYIYVNVNMYVYLHTCTFLEYLSDPTFLISVTPGGAGEWDMFPAWANNL